MTASHSSSFMRSSRLSRVMPALLTRIVIAPKRASMSASAASTAAASVTSSLMPVPALPAVRKVVRRSSPRPRRSSPCRSPSRRRAASASAIARPMPRVAPVTSATCPSSVAFAIVVLLRQSACERRQRRRRCRRRRSARTTSSSRAIRLLSPASTLPGPHSTTCVTPRAANAWIVSTQRTGLAACCASAARIASGARCFGDVDVVQHRDRRRGERHARRASPRAARPRASAASCGTARDTGSSTPRLAPFAFASADRALDRLRVPGDHDLPRRVEIDRLDAPAPCAASRAGRRAPRRRRGPGSPPSRRRPPARPPASPARGSAPAAARPRNASAPAATSARVLAEAVPGDDGRHRPARRLPGAPHRDAGGQHHRLRVDRLVELGLRAGRHQRPQVLRRAPPTPRRTSRGPPDARRSPAIIPTDCEPCPGNTKASFIVMPLTSVRSTEPQVKPPPTPISSITCGRRAMRPSRTASSSASGIDAADVLACRSTVTIIRSRGTPSFFAVASMIRMFAWCGISQSIVARRRCRWRRAPRAPTSASTLTANLNTALAVHRARTACR